MTEFNILDYKCDELTTIENDEILFMTKDEDGYVLAVYKDIKGCVEPAHFHTNGNWFGENMPYIILKPKPKKKLYIAIGNEVIPKSKYVYFTSCAYTSKEELLLNNNNSISQKIVEVEIEE